MSRRERLLNEVLDWLRDSGAHGCENVEIRPIEVLEDVAVDPLCEEYAVFVTKEVEKGSRVLGIPLICMITVEMGMVTEMGEIISRHEMETESLDLSAPQHCFLSIFLLTDMSNPESWYQPYYRSLPQVFPNIPLFWSLEDLKCLQGSNLLYLVKDRLQNLDNDYKVLCETAPSFKQFTLQQFIWARMIVASRNFGIEIDGNPTDVLCPLADMLNHRRPRETKWAFDSTSSTFNVEAVCTIQKGTELLDSYGRKCNVRYLLNYGFCVEDNRDPDGRSYNEVRFFFALKRDDPSFLLKRKTAGNTFYCVRYDKEVIDETTKSNNGVGLFSINSGEGDASEAETASTITFDESHETLTGMSVESEFDGRVCVRVGRGARLSAHHDDPCTREALSLARFMCASSEPKRNRELVALPLLEDVNLQSADECIPPLSIDNECEVLKLLAQYSQEQLTKYGCGRVTQEDPSRNNSFQFKNVRQKFAHILIEGEKEVCMHWMHLASQCIPLLSRPLPKLALNRARELAAAPEHSLPMSALRRYVEDVVVTLLEGELENRHTNT